MISSKVMDFLEAEIMGKVLKSCQIHDRGRLGLSQVAKTNTFQLRKGGPRDIIKKLEFHFAERVEHRVLRPTSLHRINLLPATLSMGSTLDTKSLDKAFEGRPDLQAAVRNAAVG
jgi:hypothetical protein